MSTLYALINAEALNAEATRAIQYLTALGFELIAVRPAPPWTNPDGTTQEPQTLIIARIYDRPAPHYSTLVQALTLYCTLFEQNSIALLPSDGKGVLLGDNPQAYSFNPQYFAKE